MSFFASGKHGAAKTKRLTQQRVKEMTGRPSTTKDAEYEELLRASAAIEKELLKLSELSQRYVSHLTKYVTSRNELTTVFAAALGSDRNSAHVETAAHHLASENEALKSILPGAPAEKASVTNLFGVFGGKKKEKAGEESSAAERLDHLQQWSIYFSKLKAKESELEDLRLELDYYKAKVHEREKGTKTEKVKSATDKMHKFEHQYRYQMELLKVELTIVKERRNDIISFAVGGLLQMEQQLVSILSPVIKGIKFNEFPDKFSPEKLQELALAKVPASTIAAPAAAIPPSAAAVPSKSIHSSDARPGASEKQPPEAQPVATDTDEESPQEEPAKADSAKQPPEGSLVKASSAKHPSEAASVKADSLKHPPEAAPVKTGSAKPLSETASVKEDSAHHEAAPAKPGSTKHLSEPASVKEDPDHHEVSSGKQGSAKHPPPAASVKGNSTKPAEIAHEDETTPE